ncbi:hypothetical protein [Streptomyces fuscichromogenes]|uniref:Uncharacterized protein n=1 Tax=Streptomyces fuscichromogenes TaxID=1324013 RepID=A0A917XBW7_9ACTN|nr:hypothetical protein [Streptomyces fuscichromogenes]GGN03778.1 hypothetical protein GCM10011578_026790 [Streptomyces fuscichromogenes]
MRYVEIGTGEDRGEAEAAVFVDPGPYLARLPELADGLPPGARAFATDPRHYELGGRRCVRDLRPLDMRRTAPADMEIRFRHNSLSHNEDLIVRYTGVSRFQTDILGACDIASLGEVILDEILPHPDGCTHELACRPGTLVMACADLVAEWVPATADGDRA